MRGREEEGAAAEEEEAEGAVEAMLGFLAEEEEVLVERERLRLLLIGEVTGGFALAEAERGGKAGEKRERKGQYACVEKR